jgi:EAL domain-containing protein (putative c-di-GMP-specific phosphodiesterase class I)
MDSELKVVSVKRIAGRPKRRRDKMAADLGDAIAGHRIDVHFQPQYELRTGRCCGVEALARWMQSNGSETPPSLFIPIAERFGMIGAIGVSVLYQSCATLIEWPEFAARPPILSVNVSTQQLTEDFGAVVGSVIDLIGFPGSCLELEVTETTLISNFKRAARCLTACKQMGVRIALDDFGAGFSNLDYLLKLPVDRIKLDRYFVARLGIDKKAEAIIRAVVALGEDAGVEVLAEGVESESNFKSLEALGCKQGQGNLLCRSVPADEARALMSEPWGARFRNEPQLNFPDGGGLHAA